MSGTPLVVHGVVDAARKTGAVRAVRDVMTPTADAVAFAVTNLGDSWFLLVALTLFYWYASDRDDGATAVGLALGALALVTALKHVFALGRPPEALRAYQEEGLGFPSGHALGSTVAYGAMGYLGSGWDRRRGLAVAVPLAAAVGLSRTLLGVHYLGSVLAGFAVGAAFLWAMLRWGRGEPAHAFAVAAALAVGAMAAGAVVDGATALGGALGGIAATRGVDLEGSLHPAAAVGGLVVFGGVFAGALAAEPPWPVLVLANAVVVAGLLATPAIERAARERFA